MALTVRLRVTATIKRFPFQLLAVPLWRLQCIGTARLPRQIENETPPARRAASDETDIKCSRRAVLGADTGAFHSHIGDKTLPWPLPAPVGTPMLQLAAMLWDNQRVKHSEERLAGRPL